MSLKGDIATVLRHFESAIFVAELKALYFALFSSSRSNCFAFNKDCDRVNGTN